MHFGLKNKKNMQYCCRYHKKVIPLPLDSAFAIINS